MDGGYGNVSLVAAAGESGVVILDDDVDEVRAGERHA